MGLRYLFPCSLSVRNFSQLLRAAHTFFLMVSSSFKPELNLFFQTLWLPLLQLAKERFLLLRAHVIKSGLSWFSPYGRVNCVIQHNIIMKMISHHIDRFWGDGDRILIGKGVFRILPTTPGQYAYEKGSQDYLSFEPNNSQGSFS